MRRLVLASWLVLSAAAPGLAATPGPAPAAPSPAPAKSPAPQPSASPAPRTFLGMPVGNRAIALGLSLAVNGLGQFYNGDAEKGRLMMAPLLVFPIAYGFDALTGGATMRVFAYTINLAIKPWSAWDAFSNAVPPAPPAPSAPAAKPTPAASPAATPKPTPSPTPKPSATPSLSPAPSPTPAASASPAR